VKNFVRPRRSKLHTTCRREFPRTYVCLSLFALQSGQIASGQNPPLPRCAHDGRHRAAAACQKADAPRAAKCKSFVTPCYLKVSAAKWIDCQLVK
jgi:hypothetical protein